MDRSTSSVTRTRPARCRDYNARLFKSWDKKRRRQHAILGPPRPYNVSTHVLNPKEWGVRADKARSLLDRLLAANILGMRCEQCGKPAEADTGSCGETCFRAFAEAHFVGLDSLLEIRRSALFGYGVYVQPGQRIESGQVLGEYVGRLRPMTTPYNQYMFDMNGERCHIDAEVYGNWTRFVNSHCDPNVIAVNAMAGGRNMVLYTACQAIGPGEQLFIDYGKHYFEGSGMLCLCDAQPRPHLPDEGPPVRDRMSLAVARQLIEKKDVLSKESMHSYIDLLRAEEAED